MADEDPFGPDRHDPAPDWMHISIQVPLDDGISILRYIEFAWGFKQVDWCIMGRDKDNARIDYDPCEPLTKKPLD